jgi:hypothetical protein
MVTENEELQIVLQVGSELRITNDGQVTVDNPEIELAEDTRAADAVLLYRFDSEKCEHLLRLLSPVARHKHLKVHQPGE